MKILKDLRIKKGKKQEDVAKVVGLSLQAVSNYENGWREPDFETLKKLADYFGVTTDYLLNPDEGIQFGINKVFRSFLNEIKKTNLSVEEISNLSGVEKQTVCKIINSEAGDIQYDDYIAIAVALDLRYFGAKLYEEELGASDNTKTIRQRIKSIRAAEGYDPDTLRLAENEYLIINHLGEKETVEMSPEFKSYLDSLQSKDKQKR